MKTFLNKLIQPIIWIVIQIETWQRLRSAKRLYSPRIYKVLLLAIRLHGNQKRRYTGRPYWFHLDEVTRILLDKGETDEVILAAALLHDSVEDVDGFTLTKLKRELRSLREFMFGEIETIVNLVDELTDEFTHEAYPELNRKERKTREAQRFAGASIKAKIIKLADMFNNTACIKREDPDFYKVYTVEIQTMAGHARLSDRELYDRLLASM